jgi:putative FmdB family regulatory protein
MPWYEYQCCNQHRTELRQGINEPRSSFIRCSACGEIARRIFSVPRIIVYMNFHEAEEFYNSPQGQAEYG